MENEGPLLQLFDKAGLLPSINYTEDSIYKHKRTVSKNLARRDPFQFKIREGITYTYALNSFADAIDRICRIIKMDGLVFYPVSEQWQSHWNPLAPGEEWKEPMPKWEESLAAFNYDRLQQIKQIMEVSNSEHENRVSLTRKEVKIAGLEEELVRCHQYSDKQDAAILTRDEMLARKEVEIEKLREDLVRCRNHSNSQDKAIFARGEMNDILRGDCLRYQEQRNRFRDQTEDLEAQKSQLSNTCHELRAERDRLQLELNQVKAAEAQRQRTIKEIDNTEDLADLGKKFNHLSSLRVEYERRVQNRRQRKERLRTHMDRSCKQLEVGIKNEKKADGFLSVLEEETRVYEEMDIDGDKDGDGNGDEVSYMDGATEIGSNDDLDGLDDIPNLSLKGRTGSGKQNASTRKKTDSGKARVTLGHIHNLDKKTGKTDEVEVWAGIDKGGKLYRRCTPLGKDGKSGKTSVKHSEIVYLPEFQNLEQEGVDTLIRVELAKALRTEEDG